MNEDRIPKLFERVTGALLALHLNEYPTAEARQEHEYDEPCMTCELLAEANEELEAADILKNREVYKTKEA